MMRLFGDCTEDKADASALKAAEMEKRNITYWIDHEKIDFGD